jgi:Protein of unknown function (DUF3618)
VSVSEDPVEVLRSDIETTRAELVETVNELSDRLSPKKRVGAVSQSVTENTKQVVGHAQQLTKDSATKAQGVAKVGITRSRRIAQGRVRQLVGAVVLVGSLFLAWRLWKARR